MTNPIIVNDNKITETSADKSPNTLSDKNKIKKRKKKSKNRCCFKDCRKKLDFMDKQMICKCKKCYCALHRPIANHTCTANHIAINQKILIKNNPSVIPSKINVV
tara:strand:+ start:259 stop:573 length:315 start_codon:yes stop_codon:yes gene_type:complete